jgi:hypothetical protein
MNQDHKINFNVYFINDIYKWGYEVLDTQENETLMRGYNYETMEAAREAGREKAITIIKELEGQK